jgi:mycoredoxin
MVEVYGADWCGDTRKALALLDDLGVDYRYINVEEDDAASAWVKNQNDGKEKKPTIAVGEKILSVPGEKELTEALQDAGLVP